MGFNSGFKGLTWFFRWRITIHGAVLPHAFFIYHALPGV